MSDKSTPQPRPTRKQASPFAPVSREEIKALPPAALNILLALRLHTSKEKGTRQGDWLTVKLTIATLIEDTDLSRSTIMRTLDWMVANLYLRKQRQSKGQSFLFMFTRGSTSGGRNSPVRLTGPLFSPKGKKWCQSDTTSQVKMTGLQSQNDLPAGPQTPSELIDSETGVSSSQTERGKNPSGGGRPSPGGAAAAGRISFPKTSRQPSKNPDTNDGSSPGGEGRVGMESRKKKLVRNMAKVFHPKTKVAEGRWVNRLTVSKHGGCMPIPVSMTTNGGGAEMGMLAIGKDDFVKVPFSLVVEALGFWETDDWATPLLALYERVRNGTVGNPAGLYRDMVSDVLDQQRPKDYTLTGFEISAPKTSVKTPKRDQLIPQNQL